MSQISELVLQQLIQESLQVVQQLSTQNQQSPHLDDYTMVNSEVLPMDTGLEAIDAFFSQLIYLVK